MRTRTLPSKCRAVEPLRRGLLTPVLVLAAGVALGVPVSANALDAVTDWNARSEAYVTGAPPVQGRTRAMIQIAVHDALNAIAPRFVAYTAIPPAHANASPEAAVATATYEVLAKTAALTQEYDTYMGAITCPPGYPSCRDDGAAAGRAAADAIKSLRATDGASAPPPPYSQQPVPGVYQPTPNPDPTGAPADYCLEGAAGPPQFEQWAAVTPFAIVSGSQFRMDPPEMFDLTSDAYARDYDEVRRVGRCDAHVTGDRTAEQSGIARYWPGGGANWNATARVILAQQPYAGIDMWRRAQLFALLNIAMADANVAVFDTKYHYRFWRPVTAIRAGNTDGNAATEHDGDWLSYLATPPYPDFTCGLTTGTGAAVEVLRRWFRTDDLAWTRTVISPTPLPSMTIERSFASLSQAAAESVDARVFGGMHFRTGCVHGVRQGEKVGRFVTQHSLKPLRTRGCAKACAVGAAVCASCNDLKVHDAP